MNAVIRTLIVDDSAFVRKVVREMLCRSPYIEVVGAARDGMDGLEMAEQLKPDVIVCDLLMPRMDGAAFVAAQMARRSVPTLILTATPDDGEKALAAMEAGAIDIIRKPTALANDELLVIREELIAKVKAAAQATGYKVQQKQKVSVAAVPAPVPAVVSTKILVIGISTGGPQALRDLLPQIPANFPVPIAIVLHMPVGYTQLFAEKLNEISQLHVVEAQEGMRVEPGMAILAQAGRHLVFRKQANGSVICGLAIEPLNTPHQPSVDVLFQSAAECFGNGTLGVVMTGMGDDGKRGAAWIKAAGGYIITEAEQSCVIYGMPRIIVEAGLSDASAPLDKMAQTIIEKL